MFIKFALYFLLGASAGLAAEKTWTGQISDSMCGNDHSSMSHDGKKVSAHDCTLACVKDGGKFVFVSDGNIYEIANQDLADLTTHAGHTVKLTGDLPADSNTITVSKIEMSK